MHQALSWTLDADQCHRWGQILWWIHLCNSIFIQDTATDCLTLFEEEVTDAKEKKQVLELIINSCMKINCLSDENYDTLVTNIVSLCSKIIKKQEQCKILLSCCYLFTNPLVNISWYRLMPTEFMRFWRDVQNWLITASVSLLYIWAYFWISYRPIFSLSSRKA